MCENTSRYAGAGIVLILWICAMSSRFARIPTMERVEQHANILQNDTRKICLLYDKPPHTASSTTTFALKSCWVDTLGASFVQAATWRGDGYDPHILASALSLDAPVIAVYRRHLSISDEAIRQLKSSCRKLFYVTSSRDMKGRLISFIKMRLSRNKTSNNATVPIRRLYRYRSSMNKMARKEERNLELYPFPGKLALLPNYVVRYDHISDDLSDLLESFGCSRHFTPTNVHNIGSKSPVAFSRPDQVEQSERSHVRNTASGNDAALSVLESIPVRYGDRTYKRLSLHAQQVNQVGLQKASEIRPLLERISSTPSQ